MRTSTVAKSKDHCFKSGDTIVITGATSRFSFFRAITDVLTGDLKNIGRKSVINGTHTITKVSPIDCTIKID